MRWTRRRPLSVITTISLIFAVSRCKIFSWPIKMRSGTLEGVPPPPQESPPKKSCRHPTAADPVKPVGFWDGEGGDPSAPHGLIWGGPHGKGEGGMWGGSSGPLRTRARADVNHSLFSPPPKRPPRARFSLRTSASLESPLTPMSPAAGLVNTRFLTNPPLPIWGGCGQTARAQGRAQCDR